jgi:hypothetical protein
MNVYRYIAESNSDAAYMLCQSKGINEIYNIDDLESSLELLVAQGEEYAMKVFNLHPDKDMLIEAFGKKEEPPIEIKKQEVVVVEEKPTSCSCKLNATGDDTQQQKNNSIVTQTNTYILLGALIVSMAIISIKK